MDASASVSGKSYPLGGMVTGYLGYGQKIWSTETDSTNSNESPSASPDWHFGYVRPNVELQTTAVTNRITGALDFYPVSILGLTAGGGADFRNYDHFSGIDCVRFACSDAITFQFAQAKLIGGIDRLSFIATARYDFYYAQDSSRPFYDYMSYLTGFAGHDDLRGLTLISLFKMNEALSVGGLGIFQQMVLNHCNSGEIFAIANVNRGLWQLSAGIGAFHSDHQPVKPSVLFLLTYTADKSIGLIP